MDLIRIEIPGAAYVFGVEVIDHPGNGWSAFLLPDRDLGVYADTREQAIADLARLAGAELEAAAQAFRARSQRN